jgi:transcriptional regulator with XRE-family HTH domain
MQAGGVLKTETIESADLRFGKRLRQERERRRITLDSIAANTKIGLGLLKGLERDDVSRWPSGIFRRSFIREYATAIGLDPDETAREFLERFPDPGESTKPAPARTADDTVLRLTLADTDSRFLRGRLLGNSWRRGAAIAWDLAACFIVGGVLFLALDQWWKPLAVTMIGYYTCGILLLGNTPGVFFFGRKGSRGGMSSGTPLRRALSRIRSSLVSARTNSSSSYRLPVGSPPAEEPHKSASNISFAKAATPLPVLPDGFPGGRPYVRDCGK